MRPAWSILIFTTLAGLAQGLLLALVGIEIFVPQTWSVGTLAAAAWTVLALLLAGLAASVFHLGHPERAWRAASQWRTSWLSREVIVLPLLIVAVGAHALALTLLSRHGLSPAVALAMQVSTPLAVIACAALWWCTGMIYGCLRMLQEWATPLTPLAFAAVGLANGLALATAWFACALPRITADAPAGALPPFDMAPDLNVFDNAHACVSALGAATVVATLVAVGVKGAWWWRRRSLHPRSTLQSALAIDHPKIRQLSMGMTGGSYNTREFFHGRGPGVMTVAPVLMVALGAVLPLLVFGAVALARAYPSRGAVAGLCVAVALQVLGVLAERWLFFAWARHPQNLYYQRVS